MKSKLSIEPLTDHLVQMAYPFEAADRIARRSACRWIRVALPADGDPFATRATGCQASLFRAGYALEALSFRRRAVPGDGADSAIAAAKTDQAA